jgi:hypothetical protein
VKAVWQVIESEMISSPDERVGVKEKAVYSQSFDAIEYAPGFDFQSLDPKIGNMFRFFVDQKYIAPTHPPIAERELYGSTYYAPHSDLAAMVRHFGCLFFPSKRKSAQRRLNSISNAVEICLYGESDYHKRANVIQIPPEFGLRGVVVTVCIENTPTRFSQVFRNGIRSKDAQPTLSYSLRIAHFYLVSAFDDMPRLVAPSEYVRQSFHPIQLRPGSSGEMLIPFSSAVFSQIFTRLNITNGMFAVFRIFFVLVEAKVEVSFIEGTRMKLSEYSENAPALEIVKRKLQPSELVSGELSQFEVSDTDLLVNGISVGPISGIIMVQMIGTGKGQRSKDKLS